MLLSPRDRYDSDWPRVVGIALAVAVLLGGGAWFWLRSDDTSDTPPQEANVGEAMAAPSEPADSAPDLPPLEASDATVRSMVAGLSSRPQLAEWLATEDLARRFVGSVVQVAAGRSPRDEMETLEPEGNFRVQRTAPGTPTVVDPASYRRYDPIAATFVSLDTEGTAELYRRLRPLFQQAYRDLGFQEGSFDGTLARAIEEMLAVPVPEEGPVAVVPDGATAFAYRNPDLEELSPAQKHLLRMGPENIRRIQAKLRELAEALELPMIPARGEGGSE